MKKIIFSASLLAGALAMAQNTGIGTTKPDNSAQLEVASANKGLLIPRVALTATNAASPITTPATGLTVFNTATAGTAPNNVTQGYYYWDGAKWVRMANSADLAAATAPEPWYNEATNAPATANNQNIYQNGDVAIADNGNLNAAGNRLYFGRGTENTDPLFIHRYNGASDATQLRISVGDNDGFTDDAVSDQLVVGNTTGTTFNEKVSISGTSGQVKIGTGAKGAQGVFQILPNQASPISTRLLYGTDDTGWKFSIGKNKVGTITDQFVIQDNGNAGIGISSPEQKLDVNGDALFRGRISLRNANTTHQIFNYPESATNNPLYLGTAKNTDGSKNGIILYNLSCDGGCNVPKISLLADNTVTGGTATIGSLPAGENNDQVVVADGNGLLKKIGTVTTLASSAEPWYVAGTTTRATENNQNIYQSGNVGIATSNPSAPLDIQNLIRFNWNSAATNGIGIASTGAGGGGWARGYNFTNAAGTTMLGGFGALGNPDSVGSLWIGKSYDNYIANFDLATRHSAFMGNATVRGFDFALGDGDQTIRGNSGGSRALVKTGSAEAGSTLTVNYGNDFTAGTRVDSKLFVTNTAGAADAENDKVLTIATNGEVKNSGSTLSQIASSSEPWFNETTNTSATANNQNIYQSADVTLAGPGTATGAGKQLFFGTRNDNTDPMSISRYNNSTDNTELRVQIGDNSGGDDKFIVGTAAGGTFKPLMTVDNTGYTRTEGNYLLVKGAGNEQAYIGGDGAGNDVQVGSQNPAIKDVAIYGAAGYLNLSAAAITANQRLSVSGETYLGTVNAGATSDNVLLRGGDGIVRQLPAADIISANTKNIYNANGQLNEARTVDQNGNSISFVNGDFVAGKSILANGQMELGIGVTGDRYSFIDFHASDGVDFSSRIIRNPGTDGDMNISNTGGGSVKINNQFTSLNTNGYVGIYTDTPSAPLDIQNLIRFNWHSAATNGIGIASTGAGGGGWARGYNFTNAAGTTMLGGFGATGGPDSVGSLWIGKSYDNYVANFDLATKNVSVAGFDFMLGNGDQITRGNSGGSRALVKTGTAADGSTLMLNYGNDFTAGTRVDSKLFVSNTAGAVDTANDKVLVIGTSGEVKNSGSTLSQIASSSEPWFNEANGAPATANNQNIYQRGDVTVGDGTAIGQESNKLFIGGRNANTDPVYISRFNTDTNKTDMHLVFGDDNAGEDRLIMGTTLGGFTPLATLVNNGNFGIGTTTPGARLTVAGGTADISYGNLGSNTLTRENAGLKGDAGARSGFFETSKAETAGSNYPTGASGWWHLIDTRHSNNTANNYAMQLSGGFFDQNLWFRKTNNDPATPWSKVLTQNQSTGTLSILSNLPVGNAANNVLTMDSAGNIFQVPASTITSASGWSLNGNDTDGATKWAGTISQTPFRLGAGNDIKLTINTDNTVKAKGSIYASQNNLSGGGFYLGDDGSIVDNNDGAATFRFGTGIKITNGTNLNTVTSSIDQAGNASFNGNQTTGGTTSTGYLTVRPQDAAGVEGGEIQLQGSNGKNTFQIDNLGGQARIFGQTQLVVNSQTVIGNIPNGANTDQVVVADASGMLKKVGTVSSLASSSEPWYIAGTTTPATLNTQNIYQSGNVGIRTSGPIAPLHIGSAGTNNRSSVLVTSAEDTFHLATYQGDVGANALVGSIGLEYNTTKNAFVKFYRGASEQGGSIAFTSNNDTEAMRIAASGYVGIGTATPVEKLDVAGNLRLAGGAKIYAPGRLHITGDEALYLLNKQGVIVSKSWDGNGNLTVEGRTKLYDVPAGDTSQGVLTRAADGTVSQISASAIGSASEPWYIAGTTTPATSNTQNIYQSGNVGVGISTPEQKLDVNGDALFRGRISLRNANTTHQIFNYPQAANNNPLYLGTAKNADGSKNNINLYNLSCDGGCNVPTINLFADNTAMSGYASVNNNLRVNQSNTTGQGLVLSDDGDFVDNNDSFGTFRFAGGLRVTAGANNNTITSQISANGGAPTYFNSGNFGIGTTTPGARLTVAGGAADISYGPTGSNTLTRNNAGLQGDAGARSGFFETGQAEAAGSNYPAGASGWWHLIDTRHSNNTNNFAMQIAGSFYDQNLFFRKTSNNAAQPWSKVLTQNQSTGTLSILSNLPTANGGNVLTMDAAGNVTQTPISSIVTQPVNIYNNDGVVLGPRTVNMAGNTINFNGGPIQMTSNASALALVGTDHQYIQWYPKGIAAGRKAYTGFAASNTNDFTFANEAGGRFKFMNITEISQDLYVAGTIYQTSDAKFKKDVQSLRSGLATVSALRPVSYTWNEAGVKHGGEAGRLQLGFIAQEVEKVLPGAVQTDAEGNKSVNYTQVIPVLTQSVQELKKENDELKARLEKIEALLNAKK